MGDRAYERGKYVFETVPVKGGKAEIDSGHFVEIWKYEQGQWKMWRDIACRGTDRPYFRTSLNACAPEPVLKK